MLYKFNQAVHIKHNPKLVGKTYLKGTHEVPEEVEYDPYFMKLVSLGLVVEADAPSPTLTSTPKERAESLLAKLVNKKRGAKPGTTEPASVPPSASKTVESAAPVTSEHKSTDKKSKGK